MACEASRFKVCDEVGRDSQCLLLLGAPIRQIPQLPLCAFRFGHNPLKLLLFVPRFVQPFRRHLEDTPLGGLLCSLVGVRRVPSRLRFSQQRDEQRVLRDRLQRCGDLFLTTAGRIILQAIAEYGAHVVLRGQERCREETCRKSLAAARAAGLGNAPTQDLPQFRVHLPPAFHIIEVLTIPRFLQKRRAALAELLPYAPDALRFGFERHLDNRIVGARPPDVLIAMR